MVNPQPKSQNIILQYKWRFVFYDIFEKDDECGMVIMGSFDKNDNEFFWDNPPDEVREFRLLQEN